MEYGAQLIHAKGPRIAQGEWAAARVRARHSLETRHEFAKDRMLTALVGQQRREAATGREHARHLAYDRVQVVHQHQRQVAEHVVEAGARHR